MIDIKEILTAWKNSRIMRRMGTEYPSSSAGIAGAIGGVDNRHYLTEEEAIIVDEAVLLLKKVNEKQHTVLMAYYLRGLSCNRQANLIGKRTHDIVTLLNSAESFIKGKVISYFME